MNEKILTVAAVQMDSRNGDIAGNLERAGRWADEAAGRGAELVLLPELFSTGFELNGRAWHSAEPQGGPTETFNAAFREGATGCAAGTGIPVLMANSSYAWRCMPVPSTSPWSRSRTRSASSCQSSSSTSTSPPIPTRTRSSASCVSAGAPSSTPPPATLKPPARSSPPSSPPVWRRWSAWPGSTAARISAASPRRRRYGPTGSLGSPHWPTGAGFSGYFCVWRKPEIVIGH